MRFSRTAVTPPHDELAPTAVCVALSSARSRPLSESRLTAKSVDGGAGWCYHQRRNARRKALIL